MTQKEIEAMYIAVADIMESESVCFFTVGDLEAAKNGSYGK